METEARKVKVGKTKRRRKKKKRGRNKKRKNKKQKTKREENNRSNESSREVGNLERKREDSKIRRRSKKAGTRKIPQVDPCLWQKS